MTARELDPLAEAYSRRGLRLPAIERVEGSVIPQPYRDLLVHDRDMTPTLEAFHGELIHLRVMSRDAPSGILFREVVLVTTAAPSRWSSERSESGSTVLGHRPRK